MDNQHKDEIKKLKNGEYYLWPESDYGKAEIWRIYDVFILFEIPMFGGCPRYANVYNDDKIDLMIKTVEGWT